jgi:nucleoid-associated protein YgaU
MNIGKNIGKNFATSIRRWTGGTSGVRNIGQWTAGKEVRIGLAAIGTLAVVLGVVVIKRLSGGSGDLPSASVAAGDQPSDGAAPNAKGANSAPATLVTTASGSTIGGDARSSQAAPAPRRASDDIYDNAPSHGGYDNDPPHGADAGGRSTSYMPKRNPKSNSGDSRRTQYDDDRGGTRNVDGGAASVHSGKPDEGSSRRKNVYDDLETKDANDNRGDSGTSADRDSTTERALANEKALAADKAVAIDDDDRTAAPKQLPIATDGAARRGASADGSTAQEDAASRRQSAVKPAATESVPARIDDRQSLPHQRTSRAGVDRDPPDRLASEHVATDRVESMREAPRPARPADGKYTIEPNDNFWTISEKVYGVGGFFKALIEHNRQGHPRQEQLRVGDVVLVPEAAELRKKYPDLCPKDRGPAPGGTARTTTAVGARGASAAAGLGGRVYVVEEGDTIYDIARYELGKASRWAEIIELNRDVLGNDIHYLKPGARLILPARHADPPSGNRVTRQPERTERE